MKPSLRKLLFEGEESLIFKTIRRKFDIRNSNWTPQCLNFQRFFSGKGEGFSKIMVLFCWMRKMMRKLLFYWSFLMGDLATWPHEKLMKIFTISIVGKFWQKIKYSRWFVTKLIFHKVINDFELVNPFFFLNNQHLF